MTAAYPERCADRAAMGPFAEVFWAALPSFRARRDHAAGLITPPTGQLDAELLQLLTVLTRASPNSWPAPLPGQRAQLSQPQSTRRRQMSNPTRARPFGRYPISTHD